MLGSTVYTETTPVEREVVVARGIYESCEQAIRHSLEDVRAGGKMDSDKLTGAVTGMTQSIERNPDAMMLLNTLREKGSYELGRALDSSILMVAFGRFLQFDKGRLEVLGLAGMLLDVGKTKLPDALLRKKDMLSPEESDEPRQKHVGYSVESFDTRRRPPCPASRRSSSCTTSVRTEAAIPTG